MRSTELFFPSLHHAGDELRDGPIVILRIRKNVPALDFTFTRHGNAPETPPAAGCGRAAVFIGSSLRPFGPVLRAALSTILHSDRVERAADDVVAHARQVLHAASADEHDGVLLQVVTDAGDVRDDLDAVRETAPSTTLRSAEFGFFGVVV